MQWKTERYKALPDERMVKRTLPCCKQKIPGTAGKRKACYFADDLFGLLLQLGRDVVCYGYLIGQLMQGMSIARFVLYIGIVSGFSTYFSELTMMISQISSCLKPVGQMQEFTELENVYHHGEGVRLKDEKEAVEVEFSHVSFSYPGTDHRY